MITGEFALPAVTVLQKFVLVVVQFLASFGGEFEVWALDNGIHRAGFLAEAAIDAFHHIDVVTHRPARAIVAAWPASIVMA